MRTAVKRSYRYSPEDTAEWLRTRMDTLKISGLEELHQRTGIDRGSLSRYFRQERVPKIDVIGPLCKALEVSPETLLVALGAIERKSKN
jgi:transcriptional regulator with XRE-family HTH domain